MQETVLYQERNSVTSGDACNGDILVGGTRFTGDRKLSQAATTPHEGRGWMRKIARAVVSLTRLESRARRNSAHGTHQLSKGRVKRMHLADGGRISCHTGSVWITADGGGEDIVLSCGDCRSFRPGARVLIEAIAKSQIIVES